ncbi:MAG: hypothetical protein ACT4OF_02480 [Caulobacteraceae bacterium]
MGAYVIQVRRESLGGGPATIETVCAIGDSQAEVLTLVRTALRLEDEKIEIVRGLASDEVDRLGLKPFQVKHLP